MVKNLKFVNRDGSYTYATAMSQAHPKAIQISDYFHLLKNLCDHLKEHLVRKLPRISEIEGFFYNGKITIDKSVIKSKDKYKSEWELSQLVKKCMKMGIAIKLLKKYLISSIERLKSI